jgi:nucleotide-binding universal stress UspA family protein
VYRRMLVTVDGTRRSEAVIAPAIELARHTGCSIKLLTVVIPEEHHQGALWSEEGSLKVGAARGVDSQVAGGDAYVSHLARIMREQRVSVEPVVRKGRPGPEIINAISELGVDFIAMATRSRRGVERLVFGSVAEYVLREAHIPVLLITAR